MGYIIAALVYYVWAIYSGWKLLNGRFEFLEREGAGYKILKFICISIVGIFYGGIYLILRFLQFVGFLERNL